MSASSDTGGQAVDYKVYWNQGPSINTWTLLVATTGSATTYTTTASLTTGDAYQFKVVAFNDYGSGPESSIVTVYAAIAPSGLAAPTTTYNSVDSTFLIEWSDPTDTGGLTIASYTIEVKIGASTYQTVDQSTECTESAANILSLTQCTISVATLSGSPYSLASSTAVIARITATQTVGSVTSADGGTDSMP